MKSSSLIVWLLFAAFVAIDLAMIRELQVKRNEWPEAGGVIGLGLSFSQIALLALWAVWGRSKILFRAVNTLLGVWAVGCLASFSAAGNLDDLGVWFGVLLFYCCVSLIPFVVGRVVGYELFNQYAASPRNVDRRLTANQFTIWGILSLTTAVGIALAVIPSADFPTGKLLEVAGFFTLLAVTVCGILLLALLLSRIVIVILATVVICPAAGTLLSLTKLAPGDGPLELVLMMCVQGVVILSAAIILRTAGYRLARQPKSNEPRASGSSDVSMLESEGRGGGP